MSYSLSPWVDTRFFITGTNRPLAGGKLYTYQAGTTTNATTYSDDVGTPNTNPITLNADGKCNLYLDDSVTYRFILKNAAGATQFDRDNVKSSSSTKTQSVDTIKALLSVVPSSTGTRVIVSSYWDGWQSTGAPRGGGVFVWSETTPKSLHNGGTIISPTVPWDGTVGGHASFSGQTTTYNEMPAGTITDGYPTDNVNNITCIRKRNPIMVGFLGGYGETQSGGSGCWVREDAKYSFCNFGAKGDASYGVDGTDDSYAMLQCVRSVPKSNGVIDLDPYYYTHGSGDNRVILLYMVNYKNLVINGNGAVIQSHSSNPALVANAGWWWLNCAGVTVNDLGWDGRLDVRTPIVSDPNQTNKQHGFNIGLNCSEFTLNGCTSKRAMMDGFWVGGSARTEVDASGTTPSITYASPSNVVLNNCTSEYNYRQGLSISRVVGLAINGGSYSYTGQLGAGKGTSPQAGIDSESEGVAAGNYNFGLTINGARILNNAGAGVDLAIGSLKSIITGCYIVDNGAYGIALTSASRHCVVSNNFMKNNGTTNSADGCEIYNLGSYNTFKDNIITPTTRAILDIETGGGVGSVYCDNVIDNSANTANAGYCSIAQAWLYSNNKHLNLQSSFAGHCVFITSPSCIVINNSGKNTNISNTFGFMRVNSAAQVRDNTSTGYALPSGYQIYIKSATLNGAVRAYSQNFEDSSYKDTQSMGAQVGNVDYPPVIHNQRRLGWFSAIPSTGDWQQGDVLMRSNVSATNVANSNAYWICSTTGTYSTIAATGDITIGTKTLTNLSNLTKIYVGTPINVAGAVVNSIVTNIVVQNIKLSSAATLYKIGGAITGTGISATGDSYPGSDIIKNVSNLTNMTVGSRVYMSTAGYNDLDVTTILEITTNTVTITNNATATVTTAAVSGSAPVFIAKDYQSVKGSTASRPSLSTTDTGYQYFDTTLVAAGKPIFWSGTAWVDSTGTAV